MGLEEEGVGMGPSKSERSILSRDKLSTNQRAAFGPRDLGHVHMTVGGLGPSERERNRVRCNMRTSLGGCGVKTLRA